MSIPRKLKTCIDCKDPRYIFSHGRCIDCHNRFKSRQKPQYTHTTLTQTTGGKVAKPFRIIKKVSDRQSKLNAAYSVLAAQFKKDNPYCKACLPCCTYLTTDIHHKKGRGEYLLDSRYFLPVCRECHSDIEQSPEKAKELGLSLNRLDK